MSLEVQSKVNTTLIHSFALRQETFQVLIENHHWSFVGKHSRMKQKETFINYRFGAVFTRSHIFWGLLHGRQSSLIDLFAKSKGSHERTQCGGWDWRKVYLVHFWLFNPIPHLNAFSL